MPTPVSNARQCLAVEAAAALNDAVDVARRRVHAQTTSLHVVYALLHPSGGGGGGGGGNATASTASSSSSSSLLRDALARARSSAFSPRLQFKALELCFGVALDRLPSSTASHHQQTVAADDPPVSNSLMAAIKRSQANQRRNPDTFHFYQQQSCGASSSTSSSGVKVELQQLVIAILDDPVVSRVFSDAGFQSSDIKLAILRPPPPILRFQVAARCPPLFLCNFSSSDGFDAAFSPRGFSFPFSSPGGGQPSSDGAEGNRRRIGEILVRRIGGRNPMLVGAGAAEAALDFAQAIDKHNWTVLPPELRGIKLVNIENKLSELRNSRADGSAVPTLLEEIPWKLDTPGTILSIGDLKEMVRGESEGGNEQESFLVSEITRLLEVHHGRMWVMVCSANYETYMKFLSRYPLLDKDWDLQLLPITSVTGTSGSMPKPPRLESFAPFGGLFPTANERKSPSTITHPSGLLCEHCNNKYELELSALLKEHPTSTEDQQSTNLPFWLQKTNVTSMNNDLNVKKAKDDKSVLNSKIMSLQRKWNEDCQRLHRSCQKICKDHSQPIPSFLDPPNVSDNDQNCDQNSDDKLQSKKEYGMHFPLSADLQTGGLESKKDAANQCISLPSDMEQRKGDLASELQVKIPSIEQLKGEGFHSNQDGHHDGRVSPSSVTSVLTDLVLASPHKGEMVVTSSENDNLAGISRDFPTKKIDMFGGSALCAPIDSSHTSSGCARSTMAQTVSKAPNLHASTGHQFLPMPTCQKFDVSNYKSFYTSLIDKVGRQEEAISSVVQAIAHRRMSERHGAASLKGDMWLGFHGSDRIAMKKTALALAELMCGSKDNFTCVDLSYQDGTSRSCTICDQQDAKVYDEKFRGKTNVDYIAEILRKKPKSVIFLQNIDNADFLVQNSLMHAIRNGKFPNSHGREFSASDATFIVTTATCQAKTQSYRDCMNFCEETILAAQRSQMVISVKQFPEAISPTSNVSGSPKLKSRNKQVSLSSGFDTKRKLDTSDDCTDQCESIRYVKRAHKSTTALIDLNMPVEEYEDNDVDTTQSNLAFDSSDEWMEEFFSLLNARVEFKPFNFDALADDIMKDLSQRFSIAFGAECSLEIDLNAMLQILAAAWSAEDRGALSTWFDQVLGRSFFELNNRNSLSAHTVVRLFASEEAYTEEHATGIVLPSRIIVD